MPRVSAQQPAADRSDPAERSVFRREALEYAAAVCRSGEVLDNGAPTLQWIFRVLLLGLGAALVLGLTVRLELHATGPAVADEAGVLVVLPARAGDLGAPGTPVEFTPRGDQSRWTAYLGALTTGAAGDLTVRAAWPATGARPAPLPALGQARLPLRSRPALVVFVPALARLVGQ